MTECAMMVAPAALSSTELTECLDPSVAALIAEVDAILCAAEAPDRQRPTPPVIGCALRGPRCAGRSFQKQATPPRNQPVRRVDPLQRSPPTVIDTERLAQCQRQPT